ncbi:hypothetical protein ACQRC6_03740 [Peptoniphilus sp. SGI.035]|uniref:hypothetical protein n=1 Tax=Peptoniphilus sp. SGI.035 TaxID=3420564 RepID=UPI003CFDC490
MKKYINFIISFFCFPILNLACLKIFGYINEKIQATFDIKYMIVLAIVKIIMILFLGFMLAYYFNFASKLSKRTNVKFLLIEILIFIIYMVIKKYYSIENIMFIYDFTVFYFLLIFGENIFLLLNKNS